MSFNNLGIETMSRHVTVKDIEIGLVQVNNGFAVIVLNGDELIQTPIIASEQTARSAYWQIVNDLR